MAVYGDVRVSTDRQADDGESLGTQHRVREGYAMMQGLPLDAAWTAQCCRPDPSSCPLSRSKWSIRGRGWRHPSSRYARVIASRVFRFAKRALKHLRAFINFDLAGLCR
jgi:putative DNA-invertase from lambdoid prophage Rac